MSSFFIPIIVGLCWFLSVLVFLEFGRRFGLARLARDPNGLAQGIGPAEGAIFALLGLMLAFTFSGAATRFEDRRHLITDEANMIGTAYLRLDLLPANAQPELRKLFRQYLDLRISTFNSADKVKAYDANMTATGVLQGQIWRKSLSASHSAGASPDATKLLVPALNDVIDITTTQTMATRNHPPLIIFILLGILSLVGAMLVGYDISGDKDRSWFHSVLFAAIMSFAGYVIIDLEFPRLGFIRVDVADQVLIELKKSLH